MSNTEQTFCIHFDLEGENNHSISLDHSIITQETIKTIIFELNKIIFEGKLEIEIFILPSQEGGHITNFLIKSAGIMRLFVESTTGSSMIKGLTGKEWGEYVEDKTILIKEMVIGFLEKKTTDLVNSEIGYDTFYKAYNNKNKFYEETMKNKNIKGLGFDKKHNFSVLKNEFPYRIADLKEKASSINPIEKFHILRVVSPIQIKEHKKLARKVKDIKERSEKFNAYMEDKKFYDFFLKDPFVIRTLWVKVFYFVERDESGDFQIKKISIINVYKYNDIDFSSLPENFAIEKAPFQLNKADIQKILNPTPDNLFTISTI